MIKMDRYVELYKYVNKQNPSHKKSPTWIFLLSL